ncbi:MAG: AmmeMemoRadiSam system protein B [Phycisphaerales bacterium]|nr:AmmeMemoRadiSam system protein B [Phycisphaerales bacterium]
MPADTLPEHIRRPHLRRIQPYGVSKDGKTFVGLYDPFQLSTQSMVVVPQAMQVIQQFRGDLTLDEIAERLKGPVDVLVQLASKLDEFGLLWGPTYERLEAEKKQDIAERGAYPMTSSASLGKDADLCRAAIESYFEQTEDPELEGTVRAVVAPHLDYQRGWPNYAAAYYALRGTPRPDRVVILGTNHFGVGDGAVLTGYGFDTPLGRVPADTAVVDDLVARLGDRVIIDQIDHVAEHSIQLQLPWIQHLWGDVPVVAALVPDPTVPMLEDDGERVGFDEFVSALRASLDAAGGHTMFVASADLSHVGPQFGEPRPVDEQRREDVERHDREMMGRYLDGSVDDFLEGMRWSKNPTRWCSVGNMAATLHLVQPEAVELIDYRQAFDEKGMALVSSAAIVLL